MLLPHFLSLNNLFSPIACCKMSNLGLKRGWTTWCSVASNEIAPSNTSSLTKNYLIWICLVRLWYSEYCARRIAASLSTIIIGLHFISYTSSYRCLNQSSSSEAPNAATISAFVEEIATEVYRWLNQDITPPVYVQITPVQLRFWKRFGEWICSYVEV